MDPHSAKPCPSCGKTGTKLVNAVVTSTLSLSASFSYEARREFWEHNRPLQVLLLILILADVAVGALVDQLAASIVVGIVLGLGGHFLSPYAAHKVREIQRGSA